MTYRSDFLVRPPLRKPVPFAVPDDDGSHWIYYHLGRGGEVLYIGRTASPAGRSRQHEIGSRWFTEIVDVIWFGPMDEVNSVAVERELIALEDPPNNIRHTSRDPVSGRRVPLKNALARVERLEADLQAARERVERLKADEAATP